MLALSYAWIFIAYPISELPGIQLQLWIVNSVFLRRRLGDEALAGDKVSRTPRQRRGARMREHGEEIN